MPTAPKSFMSSNAPSRRQVEKAWQSRRNGNHDLYNLWIWRKPGGIRDQVLRRDPLCVDCLKKGVLTPSTEADHEEPHNGDMQKFLDVEGIRGRCKSCHSRKTMKEQQG